MAIIPIFSETAEHRSEETGDTPEETMFNHPSAVSVVEKIDYLYEQAQKIAAIVDQITPAQIQQANNMANSPLGALFTKLIGH